jgi:hypothetical protein
VDVQRCQRGRVVPYQPLPRPFDPTGNPRPLLPVQLFHGSRAMPTILAIVDSGADVSMFHVSSAQQHGLDLTDPSQCRQTSARGVSGQSDSYSCRVEMEVEGKRFTANVLFTQTWVARLGRLDVFLPFRLYFDEIAQELLVEPY